MQRKKDIIDRIIKNMIDAIRKRKVTIISLASIVVVVTVYSLILPGMTLEKDEAAKQGGIDLPAVEEVQDEEKTAGAAEEKPAEEEPEQKAEKEAEKEPEKESEKETVQNPAEKPQETNSESDEKGIITRKTELTKDGKDYSVSVLVGKNAELPQDTVLSVKEIKKDGTTVEAGTNKKTRTAEESGLDYDKLYKEAKQTLKKTNKNIDINSIRFYDITLLSGDDSVEPSADVDVKITLDSLAHDNDEADYHIVHFGEKKTEVLDSETIDDEISFKTDGFSVYAVIGGTEPTARMQINFHGYDEEGNEKTTTMYIKNEDSADHLEMILYDPGVGKLGDGEMFRGWTMNENYTVAQATSAYDATSNPSGAMTIEDVRDWAQKKQSEGIVETNPITAYDFYPMIVKHYTVTYLDRFGVSIDTDSAYMLRNETKAEFTINMNYETNNEDYHFKGWISNDQNKITLVAPEGGQAPELEQVTILDDPDYSNNPYNLYKNNTKVKVSGDVTLKAHAPKGKWLIFHEVEKGATYVAPQFLEEGDSADMPNPDNMYLLGYTFAGWYKGDPIYGDDGITVIGATPNYNEDHLYTGDPIDQKTHVYAKWVPTELAPYTVIIWKQNLNGTYAYAESVKLGGTVNSNIENLGHLSIVNNNEADYLRINGQQLNNNQTALVNYTKTYEIVHSRTGGGNTNNPYVHHYYTRGTTTESEYVGFNCARIEYEDEKIKPEGTSIVNVYYDRITYTVRVYYARENVQTGDYHVATGRNNEGTNPMGPSSANFGMTFYNGNNNFLPITWHRDGNGWARGYSSTPVNPQSVVSGNYRYYYTTITAKYGANIADQWPKYSSFPDLDTDNTHTSNNNNSSGYLAFVSWYMMNDAAGYRGAGSGLNTFKGVINKMDEKLLGDITQGTDGVNILFGRYDTRPINIYTYKIWKEALLDDDGNPIIPEGKQSKVGPDGLTYYLDESIQANSNAQPSGTQAPNYIGFENFQTDKPADNNQTGRREDIVCWYHRVKNPIIYRDGSYFDGNGNRLNAFPPHGEDQESDPIPYEANIESYNGGYNEAGELEHGDNYKMDYPSSYDGFVFEGWYIDEACTQPYNFTVMPDSSITVYAKFRQVQYRVFLHPQVPTGKVVDWGSATQQLNFRGTYGATISLPTGKLIMSEDQPENFDDSYEFAGWYRDPQGKQPYDPDAYVLNDDLASPYDKTQDMTDYMDKYGNINNGPNNEPPYNSDIIGNNGGDRWWISKKIDLYGKWIKKMEAGEGIQVIYDPNGGSAEVKDDTLHKDQTNAVAQSAPVTSPTTTITHSDGTTETVDRVFLYWVLQTWDPEANDGEGGFVDVAPLEFVYPGDTFTVSFANAHTVETTDPNTGETTTEHFVQLRAEYTDPEKETPTHIWWYSNFGDNAVEKVNLKGTEPKEDAEEAEEILINESVYIKPENTFTRPGYKFLGWARVPSTDAQGHPISGHPKLYNLGEGDLFLKYVEAEGEVKAHYEAKDSNGNWVTVTKVAADEKMPYHDMYAVWACEVKVVKLVQSGDPDDEDIPFEFTPTIGGTASNKFYLEHRQDETFDIAEHGSFIVSEKSSNDFTPSITVTNLQGQPVIDGITVSEGTITIDDVDQSLTITYTNSKQKMPIRIVKIDQTEAPLAGAGFSLNGPNVSESNLISTIRDVPDGDPGEKEALIYENELAPGTYTLAETTVPDGYHPLAGNVTITISDDNELVVKINGEAISPERIKVKGNLHIIEIMNSTGTELPMTGGPGTTAIYLFGMLLVLGSFIGLVAKKRVE